MLTFLLLVSAIINPLWHILQYHFIKICSKLHFRTQYIMSRLYSIIELEDGNQLVPTSWLHNDNSRCYWPKLTNSDKINQLIEKLEPADPHTWCSFRVLRMFGTSNQYESGIRKLKWSKQLLDVDTITSESKRKGKHRKFILVLSSDESDDDISYVRRQNYKRRKLLCRQLQSSLNDSSSSNTVLSDNLQMEQKCINFEELHGPRVSDIRRQKLSIQASDIAKAISDGDGKRKLRKMLQALSDDDSDSDSITYDQSQNKTRQLLTSSQNDSCGSKTMSNELQIKEEIIDVEESCVSEFLQNIDESSEEINNNLNETISEMSQNVNNQKLEIKKHLNGTRFKLWVIQKLNTISHDIKALQESVPRFSERRRFNEEDSSPDADIMNMFPITDEMGMDNIEEFLGNDSNKKMMVVALRKIGGGVDGDTLITNILKKCLSNNVAEMYSFLGTKQKKRFKELKFSSVVLGAVRFHNTNITETTFSTVVSCWLKHAKQRRERSEMKMQKQIS